MNRRTFLGALLALPAALRARPAAAKPKPWTQLIIGHPIEFRAERAAPSVAKSAPTTITLGDGTVISLGAWLDEPLYETIAIRARPRWWRRLGRRHTEQRVESFTTGHARAARADK